MNFLATLLIATAVLVAGCAQKETKSLRFDANVSVVKFKFNKSTMAETLTVVKDAKNTLDAYIKENDDAYGSGNWKVGVVGRTDFKANEKFNDKLGMKRAKTIAKYLAAKGVDVFLVVSAGETDDVVTKPYRAENFRGIAYRETNRSVTLITLHY